MHNAYCDADENSLDLRIYPKQHTTCASVCGKRSRSYNYGTLSRHSRINTITAKANKLLGLGSQSGHVYYQLTCLPGARHTYR